MWPASVSVCRLADFLGPFVICGSPQRLPWQGPKLTLLPVPSSRDHGRTGLVSLPELPVPARWNLDLVYRETFDE